MARETLERGTTNLLGVSSALDLVERLMVWLCPEHMQRARIEGLLVKFGSLSFKGRDLLKQRLETLAKLEREQYPGQFRSVLDETTGIFNAAVVEDLIASGLQINRLRAFRNWGLLALFIFLLVAPLATNTENVSDWPSRVFDNQLPLIESWINALAMMIVGGMGGFLSGLLQARSTRVTLAEYLESMLRLQLRPLVGALVAVVLYTILSWQLLAGIEIRNAGSYFLIAFLSGFSERYFLRLLKTETQESAARVIETGEPADAGRENKH
jgi:hypothetical protein